MSDCHETVVLVLKDVVLRYTDSKLLGDILAEKYRFSFEENKIKKISRTKNTLQQEEAQTNQDCKTNGETVKYSATRVLSGKFLDAEIELQIFGEVIQNEDCVTISDSESYKVYSSKYQLIKIIGRSGYAITQFFEQASIDLGLEAKSKDWFFHRTNGV